MTIILGIETSCDETAVALVDHNKHIIAHHISSQIDLHQKFGGVVPEVAARQHLLTLDPLIQQTFLDASLSFKDLDAIAATTGPGLIGGLLVGATMAKTVALTHNLPFIAVNHLEAHALTARLTEEVAFPFLLLLVSGGHCQIIIAHDLGKYELLGETQDDAAGEAFDKVAKMLDLPYPGGPSVEKMALNGDPNRFSLPQPMKSAKHCDFSFSGLKTAVLYKLQALETVTEQDKADICASFQAKATACLSDRLAKGIELARKKQPDLKNCVIAGGVAANQMIRQTLQKTCETYNLDLFVPPVSLCTDNAAMIAWAGMEYFMKNPKMNDMDVQPRPRWPL